MLAATKPESQLVMSSMDPLFSLCFALTKFILITRSSSHSLDRFRFASLLLVLLIIIVMQLHISVFT